MSSSPRPTEPQLPPEGMTNEAQGAPQGQPHGDEGSAGGEADQEESDARPYGNLTENLTTRWNVESR